MDVRNGGVDAGGSPPPATQLGRFQIERRLGSGGMGVVYLGRDQTSGGLAAVKVIRAEHAAHPQLRARLRREVAAARRVPRFCTAPVLDADLEAHLPWVATEYVDAPTLDAALLERGPLTGVALEAFAIGVAVALRAIHQHGVIHRDLKPSNVLLSAYGPRVIDFGIAQLDESGTRITHTGAFIGTPAYMAPEQVRGEPITAAADVFAWAGLVTYAATGRAAFGGQLPLYAILHQAPDLGGLAGPLRELVAAAFAKDPAARPSAAELVDRLAALAPGTVTQVLATAAAPPPRRPAPPRRSRRRVRALLAAAAATVLAAVGTVATVSLVRGDPPAAGDAARAAELATASVETAGSDPHRAMELALDAWAEAPTAAARGALLSAATHPYAGRLGSEPGGSSIAVDPAGTTVAVGHFDGTVQLWDATTGQPLGDPLTGHEETVYWVQFSPDGDLLATAGFDSGDAGLTGVRIWQVRTGRLVRTLPGVGTLAWLPDGQGVVAITVDTDGSDAGASDEVGGQVGVWDPETGEELATIPTGELVLDVAVSPDGTWVAAGRHDGTAEVWRLADGDQVAQLSGHATDPVRVAFAPDGALATVGAEGEVRLWQLPEAEEPRILDEGTDRTVARMLFTPDGYLITNGTGQDLRYLDTGEAWQTGWYVGFQGTPQDIAASADGKLVAATGTDGPTTLWRRAIHWLPHPDPVMDLAYHPTADRFTTGTSNGAIREWDTTSWRQTGASRHPDQIHGIVYAADGARASTSVDGTVRVHGPDGRQRAVLVVDSVREATEAAFSPDGSLLAVTASPPLDDPEAREAGNRIYLWETEALERQGTVYLGEDDRAYGVAFTPDSSQLLAVTHRSAGLSGDEPGHSALRSWRVSDLEEEPARDLGETQAVNLAVSPDGRTVAIGGTTRTVRLLDLTGDRAPREVGTHPATVREAVFSPDGRLLATVTTDDPLVRLWDVATGAHLASLDGHLAAPNVVSFSPDGRTLATGGPDGWVALWPADPADAITRICRTLAGADDAPPPHSACA